jgi:hypothetical protein
MSDKDTSSDPEPTTSTKTSEPKKRATLLIVMVIAIMAAGVSGYVIGQMTQQDNNQQNVSEGTEPVAEDQEAVDDEEPIASEEASLRAALERQQARIEDESLSAQEINNAYINAAIAAAQLDDDSAAEYAQSALDGMNSSARNTNQEPGATLVSVLESIAAGDNQATDSLEQFEQDADTETE